MILGPVEFHSIPSLTASHLLSSLSAVLPCGEITPVQDSAPKEGLCQLSHPMGTTKTSTNITSASVVVR